MMRPAVDAQQRERKDCKSCEHGGWEQGGCRASRKGRIEDEGERMPELRPPPLTQAHSGTIQLCHKLPSIHATQLARQSQGQLYP